MAKNRFSHREDLNSLAEALLTARLGELHTSKNPGISIQTFGSWCGEIMSTAAGDRFSRFWLTSELCVTVVVTKLSGSPEGVDIWDQVSINGVSCGNRCGGLQVFTALALPYVTTRLAAPAEDLDQSTICTHRDAADATLRGLAEAAERKVSATSSQAKPAKP